MLAAGGVVWVSIESGWIVRVDPATDRTTLFRTLSDPRAVAWGQGGLWVSHPMLRVVTRMRSDTGVQPGSPVPVDADTNALVEDDGSVWATSEALDQLQRISTATQRVVAVLAVPEGPAALASFAGRLFVTSFFDGTVTPVTITR